MRAPNGKIGKTDRVTDLAAILKQEPSPGPGRYDADVAWKGTKARLIGFTGQKADRITSTQESANMPETPFIKYDSVPINKQFKKSAIYTIEPRMSRFQKTKLNDYK